MADRRSASGSFGHPRGDSSYPAPEVTPRAVWMLVGTIAAAKLTTLAVIVWASGSRETLALILATLPPWLLAAVALLAGPMLFRLRLRRVRARRERLRRAEWMLPMPNPRPGPLARVGRPPPRALRSVRPR